MGIFTEPEDSLIQTIEEDMQGLLEKAKETAQEFWDYHLPNNKTKRGSERSILGVRARIRNGHLSIEWYRNQWYNDTTGRRKRKPISKYIPKGKNNRYNRKALLYWARDWERELVDSVEDRLAVIRTQASSLAKIRMELRNLQKIQQASNPGDDR